MAASSDTPTNRPADTPSKTPSNAFTPLVLGPMRLRNRFIKAATNEGMAKRGLVSKGLARFHERIAQGGAALSTVAYCATSADGRTFVDQAVLEDDSIHDFRALTDAVHRHGGAASAQITHAGSFTFLSKQVLTSGRPLSASGGFNKVGVMSGQFFKQKMSHADMKAIAEEFVAAARRAREAGFDAVELHMGHGYLLSQFISRLHNKRRDAYGGSIEQRMNFPSEVLRRVVDAVGKDLAVLVKYSMTDGLGHAPSERKENPPSTRKGNTIEDGIAIAKRLQADGVHLAILSNGLNVESITAMFGSSFPKANRGKATNPIISLGMWLQSLMEPRDIVFRENYLRDLALQIRSAVDMPLAYLGGVQSKTGIEQALSDGFDAVALGRALIFDPRFVNQLQAGQVLQSGCTACNRCVTMMYTPGGTSCILQPDKPDAALNTIGAAIGADA